MREFTINEDELCVAQEDVDHLLGVVGANRTVAHPIHRHIYWGPHHSVPHPKGVLMATDGYTALVLPVETLPSKGAVILPPAVFEAEPGSNCYWEIERADKSDYPSVAYLKLRPAHEEKWATLVPVTTSGAGATSVVFDTNVMHVRQPSTEPLPGYCKEWVSHEIEYDGERKLFDADLLKPAMAFTGATRIGLATNYSGLLFGEDGRFAFVMPRTGHSSQAEKHLNHAIAGTSWVSWWHELHINERGGSQEAFWHVKSGTPSVWVRAVKEITVFGPTWTMKTNVPEMSSSGDVVDDIEQARHWARAALCWATAVDESTQF
jgi:hypothetical protein